MYTQTNYMEENSTKNNLPLAKTNRVSKYKLPVLKLCYSQHKYKDSSKQILFLHYFSHAFERCINKFAISQILKMKKTIKQVASKQ